MNLKPIRLVKYKYLIILLVIIFITSCTPSFEKPRYKRHSLKHGWRHKRVLFYKTDTYKNPLVKKEYKRRLIKPYTINSDPW